MITNICIYIYIFIAAFRSFFVLLFLFNIAPSFSSCSSSTAYQKKAKEKHPAKADKKKTRFLFFQMYILRSFCSLLLLILLLLLLLLGWQHLRPVFFCQSLSLSLSLSYCVPLCRFLCAGYSCLLIHCTNKSRHLEVCRILWFALFRFSLSFRLSNIVFGWEIKKNKPLAQVVRFTSIRTHLHIHSVHCFISPSAGKTNAKNICTYTKGRGRKKTRRKELILNAYWRNQVCRLSLSIQN